MLMSKNLPRKAQHCFGCPNGEGDRGANQCSTDTQTTPSWRSQGWWRGRDNLREGAILAKYCAQPFCHLYSFFKLKKQKNKHTKKAPSWSTLVTYTDNPHQADKINFASNINPNGSPFP